MVVTGQFRSIPSWATGERSSGSVVVRLPMLWALVLICTVTVIGTQKFKNTFGPEGRIGDPDKFWG